MNTEQLRQVEAIARLGTVSAAAEELHLSQPALSRSLARFEKELGHPLFDRLGGRLVLNQVGALAVEHVQDLLRAEQVLRDAVDSAARRAPLVNVGTVAPAPLWRLTTLFTAQEPHRMLTSALVSEHEVLAGVRSGSFDLGIVRSHTETPGLVSTELMVEQLSVVFTPEHPRAEQSSVSFAELDGESFLLFQDIGLWRELCEQAMPEATFIVQEDWAVFKHMARSGQLPFFISAAPLMEYAPEGMKAVLIRDPSARVSFKLIARNNARPDARQLFAQVVTEGPYAHSA